MNWRRTRSPPGVCGVPLCATTLVKVAVLCVIAEEDYVGSLDDAMRTSDIPTFKRMEHYLKLVDRARRDPPRLRERIEIELTRHTDLDDSHPALSERLAAIGGSFSGMIDLQSGAAEEYFGRDRADLITGLDRGWLKSILPH